MRRAVATLVLGLVLLAAGFAWGTAPRSAVVAGSPVTCNAVLPSSWLVPGATSSVAPPAVRAACAREVAPARWGVGGLLGLGALLALVGWTAAREVGAARRRLPAYAVG